jgi:glucosamine--fructose-6-phosphate aminotransferase (isomerizing)
MTGTHTDGGAVTRTEILSQPACWKECFATLDKNKDFESLGKALPKDAEYLFIGCGSSYYLAQAAAASWKMIAGGRARALPASELLLFPELVLDEAVEYKPILVSRSGCSSEIVQAARYLERERKIPTLAISCSKDHPLDAMAQATIHVLPADEKSVVMTRSFSSMLLGLQALAAFFADRKEISDGLRRLPDALQAVLDALNAGIRDFVQARTFADYVFLGQGPLFGIACEGQLKIKEMSRSYAQVFHTLEFRHGPKAIVGPEILIVFLLSDTGYNVEREVLEEMKALGATTLVIANKADAAARKSADFLVELSLDVPECARLAGYLITCQLLGLYTGLKKGCNIDIPRNLSRAVILNSSGQPTLARQAALE